MNKRLKGTFQTKNITLAANPSTIPYKVNINPGGSVDLKNKYKGIQCRECEGYGHV